MIHKLQRKLSILSCAALFLISILVIIAINGANYITMKKQVAESLDLVVKNYSIRNTIQSLEESTNRMKVSPPAIRASVLAKISGYCVIRLNRMGAVTEWKSNSEGLYTDESVQLLVNEIAKSGKAKGWSGTQFFHTDERKYGTLIVTLDLEQEIYHAQNLFRITLAVSVLTWLLLSLCAIFLIHRTLLPVREAFQKQQQFIWDTSHELKTPIAAISANVRVLEKEIGQNEYLGYVGDEIRRMNEMVQNALILARMDSGKQNPEFAQFDLGRTLNHAALPMESIAYEHGKSIDIQVYDGISCYGNESLIHQLVTILLTNALKYSDDGGKVTLKLEATGRKRIFYVHNTGSYIQPEDEKKIFDRFYRADRSRSRDTGGSGLGLSIAKSIVDLHHGKIKVYSSQKDGTTFSVILSDKT